jgi:membrane protein
MIGTTLRQAGQQWVADKASYLGAAIAYYTLFSAAPLLIVAIAVAGLVYGEAAAQQQLVDQLAEYIGENSAKAVQDMVKSAHQPGSGWAAGFGSALLLFAALGLFQQLKTALHLIWKLPAVNAGGFVRGTVREYLQSFAVLLVAVIFATLLLSVATVATIAIEAWGQFFPGGPAVWRAINLAASLLLLTLLVVFVFRLLSDGRIAYRHLWGGGFVTAILFVLGKWLFGFYLAHTSLSSAYGAASSLVVFLVWVYYSAQMIFFGAEVVQVRRSPPPAPAVGA